MFKASNELIKAYNLKRPLFAIAAHILFWLCFFAFARIVFYVYFIDLVRINQISVGEVLMAFPNAFRLDLATTAYFIAPTFFLLILLSFTNFRVCRYLIQWINYLLILAFSLIIVGELGIYPEWKTKLTYKALLYLAHPSEVINSVSTLTSAILTLIGVLMVVMGILVYNKLVSSWLKFPRPKWYFSLVLFIIVPPFLVLAARGGLQQIPINQSQSYYSKHDLLNQGAVNSAFNLYISIFENKEFMRKNPFVFYDANEAQQITDGLFKTESDTTFKILEHPKPNIVVLILESWSADLIESLGGMPGITPEFRKLEQEGILFTQAYSSGKRSEQGMGAIFSGFPSTPFTSITVQPDKFVKLPSLTKELKQVGYQTSFYFGGQLIYGNMKAFMVHAGFDRIKEIYDFEPGLLQGKLGIHDEFTLKEQLQDLEKEPQPFFSSLFTLSSHSPYDQPMREKIQGGKNEHEYINSAFYTDWCLGQYFRLAKKSAWFKNTIFILVADHSHNTYNNWPVNSFEYNRIPILICGGALRKEYRGIKFEHLVSQTDLASTILAQLDMKHDAFYYSRNLFNRNYKPFSYFTFDYGIGYKTPEGSFIWGTTYQQPAIEGFDAKQVLQAEKEAKSLLQILFQAYLNY